MSSRLLCLTAAVALGSIAAPGCGGDAVEEDEPTLNPEVFLNQVLTQPGQYDAVTVNGKASPLGKLGFIIEQQGVSMFVDAQPQVATAVEDGEEIRLTASVEQFSNEKASNLRRRVDQNTGDSDGYDERAFADLGVRQGATYLDLIHLSGSDG